MANCGKVCSKTDKVSFKPRMPNTINAETSRKGNRSISITNSLATIRMASMPIKTPVQTSIILFVNTSLLYKRSII